MNRIKTLLLLLTAVFIFALPSTASAESFETDGEALFEQRLFSKTLLSDAPETGNNIPPVREASCSSFISDTGNAEYINRMTEWYFSNYPELVSTLGQGQPVVLFFEGGSDNSVPDKRTSAVCIVVKYDPDAKAPYIAYYSENCSTIPDYPFSYSYDNGHDGYGTATVCDGIYSLYTVNHRGVFAGLNVRNGSDYRVPGVYMNENGTFSSLLSTGINIHTRMSDSVSGNPDSPNSAGCILIGTGLPFTEYNTFIETVCLPDMPLEKTEFNGGTIDLYSDDDPVKAGMLVIDRYLYKDEMVQIYGGSSAAVEYITAFSTAAQSDTANYLASCKYYPSYMKINADAGNELRSLPSGSDDISSIIKETDGSQLTVTGTYVGPDNSIWYRVFSDGGYSYLNSQNTTVAEFCYDDISIHNETWPITKKYNTSYSLYGITASNYNLFYSITGTVYDAKGQTDCTWTDDSAPHHSYTLTGSIIDNKLAFRPMAIGFHTYLISTEIHSYYADSTGSLAMESKTIELINKEFLCAAQITLDANGGEVDKTYVYSDENGCISALPTPSYPGNIFLGWYNKPENGSRITHSTQFTDNSTIYAHWQKKNFGKVTETAFTVTVNEPENGSVSSDPETACPGKNVTLTVTPDKGYVLEMITVKDIFNKSISLSNNGDGTYSFKMPSNNVIVDASFMADNTMLNYFTDVNAEDWFYDPVFWAVKNSVTNGTDEIHFSPYATCTRAQMITFLWRAAGCQTVNYTMPFTDVPSDTYYTEAVRWAVSSGITNGTSETTFDPDKAITREQLATLIYKYAVTQGDGLSDAPDFPWDCLLAYGDWKDVSYWAGDAMRWCVMNGIVQGTGENILAPQNTASRGEIVTMFYRYFVK